VKCDETRPECQRCIAWGGKGKCTGYPTPAPPAPAPVPKGHRELHPYPNNTLCLPPMKQLFRNDEEYRAFQSFCTRTVAQLTGFRQSNIWSHLILQASEMEPCIRHAVIAIGALNYKEWNGNGFSVKNARREFAYQEVIMPRLVLASLSHPFWHLVSKVFRLL
jgi:hypothetical protein